MVDYPMIQQQIDPIEQMIVEQAPQSVEEYLHVWKKSEQQYAQEQQAQAMLQQQLQQQQQQQAMLNEYPRQGAVPPTQNEVMLPPEVLGGATDGRPIIEEDVILPPEVDTEFMEREEELQSHFNKIEEQGGFEFDPATATEEQIRAEQERIGATVDGDWGGQSNRAYTFTQSASPISEEMGVPLGLLQQIARVESNFDPEAKAGTSSATGYFQFIDGTWKDMLEKHGEKLGIPKDAKQTDPEANIKLGAQYILDNKEGLEKTLGREATNGEVYLAHFLGLGGARKILNASDDKPLKGLATDAAIKANKSIMEGKTVGDLRSWANKKMGSDVRPTVPTELKATEINNEVGKKFSDKVKNTDLKTMFESQDIAGLNSYIEKKGWSKNGVVGKLVQEFEKELGTA